MAPTALTAQRLQGYRWPGNVRELQNVIERAVIASRSGPLRFDLPAESRRSGAGRRSRVETNASPVVLTDSEMRRRERENLLAALEQTNWKIYGRDGAAELLQLKPTTLATRIRAMGLKKPRRNGETFSIVFDLFGRFAPIARQSDGRLVMRLYGAGLASDTPVSPSMVVFVVVLLASVSFDGFLHTPAWGHIYAGASHWLYDVGAIHLLGNTGARNLILTVGLIGAAFCFVAVFLGICKLMALLESRAAAGSARALGVARRYCLTLVPIAIAYHLAHYLVLLLVEGQRLYGHLSDPLGLGWDLFGTAGTMPDSSVVDARFVWLFSLLVIVIGHGIAVWLSHVAAHRDSESRSEVLLAQVPMLVLMIGYTMLSLWIIGQPIVEV